MLEHSPDSLLNLSIYTFGDYVNSLTVQWIQEQCPDFRTEEGSVVDNTTFSSLPRFTVVRLLRKMFSSMMIPSLVANDVTMKLLRHLDRQFSEDYWRTCSPREDFVLHEMVSMLLHPAVTELNFPRYNRCKLIFKHVPTCLQQLSMLKVLQLERIPNTLNCALPHQHIQELKLWRGTNEILRSLSEWCKDLRKIDIESSAQICGKGVQFLLAFKKLEQLDIRGTSMKKKDITRLLSGLAENRDSANIPILKSFGCNRLSGSDLELLSDEFPGLVSLRLRHTRPQLRDVPVLRKMRNLHTLNFGIALFYSIRRVIEAVGHQLSHLQLGAIGEVDICLVAKCCPSLVSLHLTTDLDCDLPCTSEGMAALSNFKSLKLVDLTLKDCPNLLTCVLSYCTNVKVFKVIGSGRLNVNIADVFKTNPLSQLEELHWWSCPTLLPGTAREIVQHCANLRVLQGNLCWYRYRLPKHCYDEGIDVRMPLQLNGKLTMYVKPVFL